MTSPMIGITEATVLSLAGHQRFDQTLDAGCAGVTQAASAHGHDIGLMSYTAAVARSSGGV